jgi:putative DNA primase/helicase
LDHDGTGRLFVFSTAAGLDTDRYFTPFEFLAYNDFGGDIKTALRELHIIPEKASIDDFTYVAEVVPPERYFSFTDSGNAQRLAAADSVRGMFHYIYETKQIMYWTGSQWKVDHDGALIREWQKIAERLADDPDEVTQKWGRKCLDSTRINAATNLFKAINGVTRSRSEFNQARHLLNVHNGTLNLITGDLKRHDPTDRITRMFGASYDPQAKCPNWTAFVEQTIPDPEMRAYVQRAMGYSLLGNGDQRSLFVLFGPSGTGKSTFLETLRTVFADYGTTAPAGTFKARRNEAGPTNDLHGLREKRFVVTSETADNASFDEELLKRLTGRDSIQSRELYQENQEWTPECVVWIATNHAPKFNSDDDAVWRRLKLVPFPSLVERSAEIPDMSRRLLVPEADGILNWLLAGLRDFQANGLNEPEAVAEMARTVRHAADSVARFVDEAMMEGKLTMDTAEATATPVLVRLYQEWCRNNGERSLGLRRFTNRLSSLYPNLTISADNRVVGIGTRVRVGLGGTLFN